MEIASLMQEQNSSEQLTPDSFSKHLENIEGAEEKLKASIAFMREALSQKGSPNFKAFWEVRKQCLPLFKEAISPALRSQLWNEYIELTREGRRLKNLLDQESAFAVEQIELAISVLESEVKAFTETPAAVVEKVLPLELPEEPHALEGRYPYYQETQKKLNLLNVYASRINALRKELIHLEMRIRQKNKFFQRLSSLGDQVFPPRKDLIREISDSFIQDIDRFVEAYFSPENFSVERVRKNVFFFREEIKTLQSIAKFLTLNTHAFSSTREKLSTCWDQLKGMEKELKKEFAQQKQKSSENVEKIKERITAFNEGVAAGNFSLEQGFEELDSISRWMREVELTRFDVQELKDLLRQARSPLDAKIKDEENLKRQKEVEFEKVRREKVEEFKVDLEALKEKIGITSVEALSQELEIVRKNLLTLSVSKSERQTLEKNLKNLRDQIAEREEQALLALPEGDREALENLKKILEERKKRRKEIKEQIEEYRKVMGGSALDFEKAMRFNELMTSEKDHLSKVDEGINEIERKIKAFKKKS